MDGREDKDAQNNPTENPSVTPGAIFTPQEELIEVEETTPTVDPPAVIQPIPINPNATVSTGTGDIKLPGEKKSHKKIWVVFAIVALLGVIAAGVVFAFFSAKPTPLKAYDAFLQYANYAKYGPDGDNQDQNQDSMWYLFTITASDTNGSSYASSYVKQLWSYYNEFLDAFRSADYSSGVRDSIDDLLVKYKNSLLAVTSYYTLDAIEQDLLKVYLVDGINSANAKLDEMIALGPSSTEYLAGILLEATRDYLSTRLSVLQSYDYHHCVMERRVDYQCVADLSDSELSQKETEASLMRDSIAQTIPMLETSFMESTNKITTILKEHGDE